VSEGNGTHPGTAAVCAQHNAAIANLEESRQIHSSRLRALETAQDGVMVDVLQELAAAKQGREKVAAQSEATLLRVQELAAEVRQDVRTIARRVTELEKAKPEPAAPRVPFPSRLDGMTQSSIEALDPGAVMLIQRATDAEARAKVAEAALAERQRHSDRVAAADKDDTDAELKRLALANEALEIRNRQLKTWSGIIITAITVLGGIATAYFAARGG